MPYMVLLQEHFLLFKSLSLHSSADCKLGCQRCKTKKIGIWHSHFALLKDVTALFLPCSQTFLANHTDCGVSALALC